jgi:hypothetical protein
MVKNNKDWKQTQMQNFVLSFEDFYISYNPMVSGHETAICKNGKYYILHGDHRGKYENMRTFEECFKYFHKNEKARSGWSD